MSKTETNGLTPELEQKRREAAIMFVKDNTPGKIICKQLKISPLTFRKWSNAGYWVELRQEGNRQRINPLMRKAQIMYVKDGLSAAEISQALNVSMPTLQKWNEAGRWKELRPDFELLNQHKAAGLYIEKGMKESDIAMQLGISETIIKTWVFLYGWDAARLISKAKNVTADIVADFCKYFKNAFPWIYQFN